MITLQDYQALNASFSSPIVYRFGKKNGFFTELKEMVEVMAYALRKRLRFCLYSEPDYFSAPNGWTDFFEPFCPIVTDAIHSRYNVAPPPSWHDVAVLCKSWRSQKPLSWKLKGALRDIYGVVRVSLKEKRLVRLTQSYTFAHPRHYDIPALRFKGTHLDLVCELSRMVFRLGAEGKAAYEQTLRELKLPEHYAACQIRGGDKVIEADIVQAADYARVLTARGAECVFVLTDDYRQYEQLCEQMPSTRIVTLCRADERGYDHAKFARTSRENKRLNLQKLFVSTLIMQGADFFIGSTTAGPSLFVMRTSTHSVEAIDCPAERLREAMLLPMHKRTSIAASYRQTK